MPSTITASFERFSVNLEITGLQRDTVSTRQQNVRSAVENGITVLDSFLTGSYVRQTMIAPLTTADIDIFTVLHSTYYESNSPASLLNELRRILQIRYPKTEISSNGQAVTITFEDFIVDVVPAFNRLGGGFLIPNSMTGSWISTDPRVHVEYKAQQNKVHNGQLVPIVKMLKCWNRNQGMPFVSFYLELMAIIVFHNVTISDYPSGVRFFFDKGREGIKYKIQDPVPYGGQIHWAKNITSVEKAIKLFQDSYEVALAAERFNRENYTQKAIEYWRLIFGNYFPAYS